MKRLFSILNRKNFKYIDKSFYFCNGYCDGAFGILINENIYNELINEIDNFYLPFDSGPLKCIKSLFKR